MASTRSALFGIVQVGMLLAMPWLLGGSPALAEGDAEQLFVEAVDLYQRGRDAEALAKLKEVLAANPGQEEAYRLREKVEYGFWLDLLVKGGDHELAAKRILELAIPAERERVEDAEAIQGAIRDLTGDDFARRTRARVRLATNHGAYAVPYLLEALGRTGSEEGRIDLLYALTAIGERATWPLLAVLRGPDADLRRDAIVVLGNVRDRRAVPGLLRHLESDDLATGEAELVEEALGKMGAGGASSARDALVRLALAYARKSPTVIKELEIHKPIWFWGEGGLEKSDVPPYLYHLLVAEGLCYDALEVAPGDPEALSTLAGVLFGEGAAAEAVAEAGGDTADVSAHVANASNLARAAGPEVVRRALARALERGEGEVAVSCIRALGRMDAAASGGGGDPLVAALESADKRVRYAAATSIARIGAGAGSVERDAVVRVLAQAVGEESVRLALVIDDQDDSRNALLAAARGEGMDALGSRSGLDGLARAKTLPGADLFVVRADLHDMTVDRMLGELAGDYRTRDVPVVLVASSGAKGELEGLYGDRVAGVLETPAGTDAGAALASALGEDENRGRRKALEAASEAAGALYLLAHSGQGYDLAGAVPTLLGCLDRPDAVRLPGIRALGFIGDASASGPLVAVFANTGNAPEVRGAAAVALGRISAAAGELSEEALGSLAVGLRDEDASVAAAAARALGIASLSPEQRSRVLLENRGSLGAGAPRD